MNPSRHIDVGLSPKVLNLIRCSIWKDDLELWWFGDNECGDSLSYLNPTNGKRRHISYESDGFYLSPDELDQWEHGGVALMRGSKVERIDVKEKCVELEDGRKIGYGKCLIATGRIVVVDWHFEMIQAAMDRTKKWPEISNTVSALLDRFEQNRKGKPFMLQHTFVRLETFKNCTDE